MANKRHVAEFLKGADAWMHCLVTEYDGATPFDFVGVDFRGYNLSKAAFSFIDLTDANLQGANLTGADFSGVFLGDTVYSRTILTGAILTEANLTEANLEVTDLRYTNLTGSNLKEAKLARTVLGNTIFANTDLTGVTGLEECRHEAESTVDHRTLLRSGGLSPVFLRGCGLPDALIRCYEALARKASPKKKPAKKKNSAKVITLRRS